LRAVVHKDLDSVPEVDRVFGSVDAHYLLSNKEMRLQFFRMLQGRLKSSGQVFLSYPDCDFIKEKSPFDREDGWYELLAESSPTKDREFGAFTCKYYDRVYVDPKVDYPSIVRDCAAYGLSCVTWKGHMYARSLGYSGEPKPHWNCLRVIIITKGHPLPPRERTIIKHPGSKRKLPFSPQSPNKFDSLFLEAKGRHLLKKDIPWFYGDRWWVAPKLDGLACCVSVSRGKIKYSCAEIGAIGEFDTDYSGPEFKAYCELFKKPALSPELKSVGVPMRYVVEFVVLDVYSMDYYIPGNSFYDRWSAFAALYWDKQFSPLRQYFTLQKWKPFEHWETVLKGSEEGIVFQNLSADYRTCYDPSIGRSYGQARYLRHNVTKDVYISRASLSVYKDPNNIFQEDGVYEVVMFNTTDYKYVEPNTILKKRGGGKAPNSPEHIAMLMEAAVCSELKAVSSLKTISSTPIQLSPKYDAVIQYSLAKSDSGYVDLALFDKDNEDFLALLLGFALTYPSILDFPSSLVENSKDQKNAALYQLYLFRYRLFKIFSNTDPELRTNIAERIVRIATEKS
jgi:hypothetical protein